MPIRNNLTLNDETQATILTHLATTEILLSRVASRVSGREQAARIWGMPDLGLPHNVARIMGGFYTGAYYEWETDIPIVPVDATVNSCGVAVFRLSREVDSAAQFAELVKVARQRTETDGPYLWNLDRGNHFVTYGTVSDSAIIPDGPYLVLHASAAEYKNQRNGLYPTPCAWYDAAVAIEREGDNSPRYLRYITGSTAERFIRTAQGLDVYNQDRLRYFAEAIAGSHGVDEETLNVSHYGMPTETSVAIGCQWQRSLYLMLTAPDQPLYFINPSRNGLNTVPENAGGLTLTPHGLGVESEGSLCLRYEPGRIMVNGMFFGPNDSLKGMPGLRIRKCPSGTDGSSSVAPVLERCPGDIVGTFLPVYSYPVPCIKPDAV